MNKVIKDGKVAVLYSPGFGAGWSTWNSKHRDTLAMDEFIVAPFLAGNIDKMLENAKTLDEYVCVLGADQLEVKWIPVGTRFEIDEYDGSESIRILDDIDFMVA